jgi:hypothetical protein
VSEYNNQAGTSSELTGGAGFTYEDAVVAYYLTALLREEHAAGQTGCVTRVAVQQGTQGEPLDDVIIDTSIGESARRLSLQVKRSLTISAAASNTDFRWIIQRALESRAKADFRVGEDRYGFAVEHVAETKFRSLTRLIEWAKSSPTGADFVARFAPNSAASNADKALGKNCAHSLRQRLQIRRRISIVTLLPYVSTGSMRMSHATPTLSIAY